MQQTQQVHTASTTLNTPLHNKIRGAVIDSYNHEFNTGKSVDPFLVEAVVHNVAEAIVKEFATDGSDPRELAFEAIETERAYQDAGFGNARNTEGRKLTPGEILLALDKIVQDSKHVWYKPDSTVRVAHNIRKIGGLAVQFLERYGAPKREFTPEQQAQLSATQFAQTVLDGIFGRERARMAQQAGNRLTA